MPTVDVERDEIADEPGPREARLRVGAADVGPREVGAHVDDLAEAVDLAADGQRRRGHRLLGALREPSLGARAAVVDRGARERDHVARAVDGFREADRAVGDARGAGEAEALRAPRRHPRGEVGEGGRVEVVDEPHVDVLVEAGDAERERGREAHVGLRVEAARVHGGHAGAPPHARELAHDVEVPEQRGRARLLEAEPIPEAARHRPVDARLRALVGRFGHGDVVIVYIGVPTRDGGVGDGREQRRVFGGRRWRAGLPDDGQATAFAPSSSRKWMRSSRIAVMSHATPQS